MSQADKQIVPISVTALTAESYSADEANVVISIRTQYFTAERKYSVPIDCLRDLIVDLKRLKPSPVVSNQDEQTDGLQIAIAAE